MSTPRWDGAGTEPAWQPLSPLGWLRAIARGLGVGLVVYGGLMVLLVVRLVEWPLFRLRRPVTPFITQFVCRVSLILMGLRLTTRGTPLRQPGAMVANHSSWLDILVLNAPQRLYFVAKSEVARWPGIGWLARATGTVFVERRSTKALAQRYMFEARLHSGHRLLFFPEGTSTDGQRVLAFKPTLFAAFFSPGLVDVLMIQPVSVIYRPPAGADPQFYGWWGDMDLGPHLLRVLGTARQGSVEIVYHPPVRVQDFPDRKALAAHCEAVVRAGLPAALVAGGRADAQPG